MNIGAGSRGFVNGAQGGVGQTVSPGRPDRMGRNGNIQESSAAPQPDQQEPPLTIAFWVLAGLTALMYLTAGTMKLVRPRPALLAAGMAWTENVSASGIKLIGLAEVLGALGLVLPIATSTIEPLSPVAGLCLTALMAGAVVVHHRRGEPVVLQIALTVLNLAVAALAVLVSA